MNWKPRAVQLAAAVTHPVSRWRPAVATVPRHVFTPRWWAWAAPGPRPGIDVDEYLTKAAAERLDSIGLHPQVTACDATGPLPGTYDRIVSTVAVRPIPASWLSALRPGGRLVTTITGTSLIITADKTPGGGAAGRTEWDRAGFMHTRAGPGYPADALSQFTNIRDARGDQITSGRYPVVNVNQAWDLYSMLGITAPGIQHHYEETEEGKRTAWMIHPDGSWARATATADQAPVIHQAGPRRLWTLLDELRRDWLKDGFRCTCACTSSAGGPSRRSATSR